MVCFFVFFLILREILSEFERNTWTENSHDWSISQIKKNGIVAVDLEKRKVQIDTLNIDFTFITWRRLQRNNMV